MSGSINRTIAVEREINNDKRKMGLVIDEDVPFYSSSGKEYTIYGTDLFEFGGEATLYFCSENSNPDKKLIAKIYDNIPADKFKTKYLKYLEYRENISKLIMANSDYQTKHLLPILDYGLMEYEIGDGVNPEYFVEIMPYCKDGDLDKKQLSYNELRNKLIPEINEALKCLHENGYVHRDVKPNNIFIYNGSYVLGDFGAITPSGEDGARVTLTIQISYGYAPIEALSGIVVAPTDYYAFGMSIATLYAGKYIFKGLDDKSSSAVLEVQKALKSGRLPIGIKSKNEKNIEKLIIRLLDNDFNERAGYSDIIGWIKTGNIVGPVADLPFPPFIALHGVCNTPEELCLYLNENWNEAVRYITENKMLKDHVAKYNQGLTLKIIDISERIHNKKISADAAVSQALYYLCSDALRFKNHEFTSISSFVELVMNYEDSQNIIEDMLECKVISWWISEQIESGISDEIKLIYTYWLSNLKRVEAVAAIFPALAYGMFINSIEFTSDQANSEVMSRIYHGNTPDEVFSFFKEKLDYFVMSSSFMSNIDIMLAFLDPRVKSFTFSIGNEEFSFVDVFNFRTSIESINSYQKVYTILMCLFEEICENKKAVRQHYIDKGPFACYIWIKNNIGIYSESSGNILTSIKQMEFDCSKSIRELYGSLILLESHVYKLRRGIQMQIMHLNNRDNSIKLVSEDGKFVDNNFGKHIPVGFYKLMTGN